MKKIYRKLSQEDIAKGIVFTSTLSTGKYPHPSCTTHEVYADEPDRYKKIDRLLDDKFFNKSHFKFNIIREK